MSDDAVTDLTRGVYRRLYAGFTKGQRINKMSLQAEAWFWRILATVDDFGNGEADPELCRSNTAGRRSGITKSQVAKWLDEMEAAGLILFYWSKGEKLLHVVGFEERQPAGKNGKRLKRFDLPDDVQVNPGESKVIPLNPDSSSASDNHNHNHNQDDPQSLVAQARLVFDFWREHLDHQRSCMDEGRKKKIVGRLKDGYSADELLTAVRGCKLDEFSMGKNDRNTVYDDIELICRDAAHVDKFMRIAGSSPPTKEARELRENQMRREMGWDRIPA